MKSNSKLYNLIQLSGGTFPTGGFSQSWGLETYVEDGTVHDVNTFNRFLNVYIDSSVARCEAPVLKRAYELTDRYLSASCEDAILKESVLKELDELEQLSNASKVTLESRQAGLRMGKAFLRIMHSVLNTSVLEEISGSLDLSYPVAYGIVCRLMEADLEDAMAAYVYSTCNTLVQSAVKLVPLGNTEAQAVLFEAAPLMDSAVQTGMTLDVRDITNFCPGIDIASIRHETLKVRLYMS